MSLYRVVFHNFIWFGFEGIILKDSNPAEFILKGKTEKLKLWFNVRSPLQVSRKILSEQIVAERYGEREIERERWRERYSYIGYVLVYGMRAGFSLSVI